MKRSFTLVVEQDPESNWLIEKWLNCPVITPGHQAFPNLRPMTVDDVKYEIVDYVDMFYNSERLHS